MVPPPFYTIWVEGREGGPLAEKRGFLLENGKCSFYLDQADARRKIWDLERLCLNRSSAVTYRSVEYTSGHDMNQRISLEEFKSHDLRPEFDPERYEIRSRVYGDTGGGCMVGTLEVYLSDLNKNVWVPRCRRRCGTTWITRTNRRRRNGRPGIPMLSILMRRSGTRSSGRARFIETGWSEWVNSSQKSLSPVNGKFGVNRKKYEDKGPPWCAPAARPQSPAVRGFSKGFIPPSVLRL